MMMSSIDLDNFAIVVSDFVISVLGFLLAVFLRQTNRESRSFFLIFFLLLLGYTASATICQLSGTALLSQVTLFTNSLFSSLLIPAITLYLLHCAGKHRRHSPLFALVTALWTVYFVLLVVTQFTIQIYYYTPDNNSMNPYSGSLHVLIRTRHTDAGSVITVEDNGSGFDPVSGQESGLALANIRERLEMMCRGSMTITSRDGGGTTVTMTIPDRRPEG